MSRHTFATTVTLSNNVPIETVSKMLGHTDLKTTQHYAKLLDTRVASDMNRLEETLDNKKPKNDALISRVSFGEISNAPMQPCLKAGKAG